MLAKFDFQETLLARIAKTGLVETLHALCPICVQMCACSLLLGFVVALS